MIYVFLGTLIDIYLWQSRQARCVQNARRDVPQDWAFIMRTVLLASYGLEFHVRILHRLMT